MNAPSIDVSSSTSKQLGERAAGRSFLKAVLLASTLLGGGLAVQPTDAALIVTSSGRIVSGTESGGLFGLPIAPTSLAGDPYTLIVRYDNLGPSYFTSGDGTFAQDSEIPGVTGSVTAIVNGQSLTTALTSS